MISSQPEIISLEPNCLADFFRDLRKLGQALQVTGRAEALIAASEERIANIQDKAATIAPDKRVSVAIVEWIEPLMAAGNWMPELVTMAGGINLFGEAGKHSPWMTLAEIISRNPDIIIVAPCGFDNERTLEEMPLLTGLAGFGELAAVRQKRVYVADGNQYFNRPGPRLIDSLEILAEIFYPQLFQFGHKAAWLNYLEECL
jgi:iron complex transport system substrate-binding protein